MTLENKIKLDPEQLRDALFVLNVQLAEELNLSSEKQITFIPSEVTFLIEVGVRRGLTNLNLIGFLILVNDYLVDEVTHDVSASIEKKVLAEKVQKLVELLEI